MKYFNGNISAGEQGRERSILNKEIWRFLGKVGLEIALNDG